MAQNAPPAVSGPLGRARAEETVRPSALHVAIAWTLAAALGHAGLGQRIADAINGLDPRALPVAPSLAFAAAPPAKEASAEKGGEAKAHAGD